MAKKHMKITSTSLAEEMKNQENEDQNHLTPVRMAIINRTEIASVGKNMEKREPLCTVCGKVNCCSTMEKSTEFPKKIKLVLPYDPGISVLGI